MKKYLNLFFVMVLGIMLMPMVVFAEDLPASGVHYFMTYPNNEEVVTGNYEEAANPQEKLLYTGRTNAQGEVVLNGWQDEGELRIVQKVPQGYSTEKEELTVNLSAGTAEFIDFKSVANPQTGQSLIFLGLIIAILVIAFVTVKPARKRKALVLLIPAVLVGFMAIKVMAAGDGFVIVVKDKAGNKLSNVEVEVYGKPIHIETHSIITIDANGGHFMDGTTEMTFFLPENECSLDDFLDSLTDDEYDYLWDNKENAYRDGYYLEGWDAPDELADGTVIKLIWSAADDADVISLNGNGGTYSFYGTSLVSLNRYRDSDLWEVMEGFENNNMTVIGYDDNAECSHFDEWGDFLEGAEINPNANTYYVCWRLGGGPE